MKDLASQYGPQGFHVVAVSDEGPGLIGDYVRQKSIGYSVVYADNVLRMFGGSGYPSSWLIDAQGNIVWEGHPMNLRGDQIQPLLGAVTGPVSGSSSGTTVAAGDSGGNWWVWLIVFSGVFFAGAMGWFWWSSRDKTPNLNTVLYGQQPPQGAPPQGPPPPGGPPHGAPPAGGQYGAPPQQGGHGAPRQGGYGAPQQPPGYGAPQQQGYGAPPQEPHGAPPPQPPGGPQQGGYLTGGEQQTGYSAGLGANRLKDTVPNVGGANTHGGEKQYVSNTEYRKKSDDAPYLGGDSQQPPPQQPPRPQQPPAQQPPNQEPPPLPPYDPRQHGG